MLHRLETLPQNAGDAMGFHVPCRNQSIETYFILFLPGSLITTSAWNVIKQYPPACTCLVSRLFWCCCQWGSGWNRLTTSPEWSFRWCHHRNQKKKKKRGLMAASCRWITKHNNWRLLGTMAGKAFGGGFVASILTLTSSKSKFRKKTSCKGIQCQELHGRF